MFGIWTAIKKIIRYRKYIKLIKVILCALADGEISKEEAKKVVCEAIDTFMK